MISYIGFNRLMWHRPKLIKKGCDKNLLNQKTKSSAGYRSLVIIQGANADIVRLCQNKKRKRGLFSTNKKTSMRTSSLILSTIIL